MASKHSIRQTHIQTLSFATAISPHRLSIESLGLYSYKIVSMVKQHLQVYARIKPFDQNAESLQCLSLSDTSLQLQVSRSKLSNAKDTHSFTFNRILPDSASQQDLFELVAKPVIDSCLDGYNGTIFAYGQTGSGKTFTMSGGDDWKQRGVIPRVLSYVFEEFRRRSKKAAYELQVSFIEIYNESAYDLLDEAHSESNIEDWKKIIFMEDEENNLQMKNVGAHRTASEQEALNYHMMGNYIRRVNATNLNQASSRSHCIFTLNIRGKNLTSLTETYSKLHLVDLAGSERVSRSQAEGMVLTEAKSINLSLTYLEQVIVSLNQKAKGKGKPHVPYRNSLLTTLLRDSLGGNCKTVMIATISLERANLDETISTLRFAQRVKQVQNDMTKNEKNLYSTRIDQLQKENAMLKRKLQRYEGEPREQDHQQEMRKIEAFMNMSAELQVDSLVEAKRFFGKMRDMYHSKLSEYVQQLTFISQKLERYDRIIEQKQKKRVPL